MITRLVVDNFKSLCDFSIDFKEVNVFIGSNAVGKSTILQAISFIKHFAQGTVHEFLSERKWIGNELKSKLYKNVKKNIKFEAVFQIEGKQISWSFSVAPKGEDLVGVGELIVNETDEEILLRRDVKKTFWWDAESGKYEQFPKFNLPGSMLSLIDVESDPTNETRLPYLTALKKYIDGIVSYELLSPEKMRKPSRNEASELGIGGERLASFINGLSAEEKRRLSEGFQKYYPFAQSIQTVKRRSGWIDLSVEESVEGADRFQVNVKYLSDGLLRILFLVSLALLNDSHLAILLDEVENGINPDLAAILVGALIDISRENGKQIFITTHSPTFLDYFEKEHVLLLWRQKETGFVRASHLFDIPKIKRHLSYMNLGEIWASYDQEELIRIVTESEQEQLSSDEHHQEGTVDGD